jgi:hypothetical protein
MDSAPPPFRARHFGLATTDPEFICVFSGILSLTTYILPLSLLQKMALPRHSREHRSGCAFTSIGRTAPGNAHIPTDVTQQKNQKRIPVNFDLY